MNRTNTKTEPLEQDFILVTGTEMSVRQATQYTRLDSRTLLHPYEESRKWHAGEADAMQLADGSYEEQEVTTWESTLERP
jgi:hypothetical protein